MKNKISRLAACHATQHNVCAATMASHFHTTLEIQCSIDYTFGSKCSREQKFPRTFAPGSLQGMKVPRNESSRVLLELLLLGVNWLGAKRLVIQCVYSLLSGEWKLVVYLRALPFVVLDSCHTLCSPFHHAMYKSLTCLFSKSQNTLSTLRRTCFL